MSLSLSRGKLRWIDSALWADPWIVDQLNPLDRYLFLYLLTNEHNNLLGCYEISLRTISNESGIDREEVTRMIAKMNSRVIYDNGWLILRKAIKTQSYRNPQISAGLIALLKTVPRSIFHYIYFPPDFSQKVQEELKIDESCMTLDESSYYIIFNLIKSNTNRISNVELDKPITTTRPKLPNYSDDQVKQIKLLYVQYCKAWNKNMNRYKLTPIRKAKISSRLKDAGFEMCQQALTNVAKSDWHQGDNDTNWHADLEWIFSSYEKIEHWANVNDKSNKPLDKRSAALERLKSKERVS